MNKHLFFFLIIFPALFITSCATKTSDREEIPLPVAKYLEKNGSDFIHYEMSDIAVDNDFKYRKKSYNVYKDIEDLWRDYTRTQSILALKSRIIDFGIVFNPEDSKVYNASTPRLPTFKEGQIYILNLKWMGFYGIPIAFKVNKIDSQKKMIEFIYMKENICNGFQQIYFTQDHDSQGRPVTRIEHISYFKTKNKFIETFIYPRFHKETIEDFHEKIFELNGTTWDDR